MTNHLVCRLRQPLPQHCIWPSVLRVLRTVWDPTELGLPQTAGEVSHHLPGSTGEGNGLSCSAQGTDSLATELIMIGMSDLWSFLLFLPISDQTYKIC